jgi:hypothetical protein
MASLGELYPCSECARHLRTELAKRPPRVGSRQELSNWMCALHNRVNERLGKPAFNCAVAQQRWREGPLDGSCGTEGPEH